MLCRATCGAGAWKLRYRAISAQDWLEWRFHSVVDDLVLEIDLTRGVNTPINEFRAGYRLYETIQPPGQPYLLVPGELRGQRVSLPEAAERMDKWPLPQLPLFVDPAQAGQLEDVYKRQPVHGRRQRSEPKVQLPLHLGDVTDMLL